MKNYFFKLLPIIIGAGLGWLIFNPPDWPVPSGAAGFLIGAGIVFALLIVSIVFSIGLTLPKEISLSPYAGAVDPSMRDLAGQIKNLGFVEAGGPMLVGIRPAAILMSFVHSGEPAYATIFRTGTVPAVTSYDFVSILEGSRGGLTTNTNWRGGTMPSGPGEFRQILTGAGPKEAFDAHREGLRWLRDRGLPVREISAETFVADFKHALGRQRETFRSTPVKFAVIGLARTISKQVPQRECLASQKGAESQARKLSAAGK